MIKVKGTAVSKWVKSKLWFSLNAETLITTIEVVLLLAGMYVFMVLLKAIFG